MKVTNKQMGTLAENILITIFVGMMFGGWIGTGVCGVVGIIRGIQRGEYLTMGAGIVSSLVFIGMGLTPWLPPGPIRQVQNRQERTS